jgi:hypothetical protein
MIMTFWSVSVMRKMFSWSDIDDAVSVHHEVYLNTRASDWRSGAHEIWIECFLLFFLGNIITSAKVKQIVFHLHFSCSFWQVNGPFLFIFSSKYQMKSPFDSFPSQVFPSFLIPIEQEKTGKQWNVGKSQWVLAQTTPPSLVYIG